MEEKKLEEDVDATFSRLPHSQHIGMAEWEMGADWVLDQSVPKAMSKVNTNNDCMVVRVEGHLCWDM